MAIIRSLEAVGKDIIEALGMCGEDTHKLEVRTNDGKNVVHMSPSHMGESDYDVLSFEYTPASGGQNARVKVVKLLVNQRVWDKLPAALQTVFGMNHDIEY